jgi:hypothetical protein
VGRRDEAAAHLDDMQAVLEEHQKAADQVAPTYKPPGPAPSPWSLSSSCQLALSQLAAKQGGAVKRAAW